MGIAGYLALFRRLECNGTNWDWLSPFALGGRSGDVAGSGRVARGGQTANPACSGYSLTFRPAILGLFAMVVPAGVPSAGFFPAATAAATPQQKYRRPGGHGPIRDCAPAQPHPYCLDAVLGMGFLPALSSLSQPLHARHCARHSGN